MLRICILLILLIAASLRASFAHAQSPPFNAERYTRPGESVVALDTPLIYRGKQYRIYYFTTGTGRDSGSSIIGAGSAELFRSRVIEGLLVTSDDQVVTDPAILQEVLDSYRVAHYVYRSPKGNSVVVIENDFADEMRDVTNNPLFAALNVEALFKKRQEYVEEALRSLVTTQRRAPTQIEEFAQEVRQAAERGQTVPEAIDQVLLINRFSNDKAIRRQAEDVKRMFKSWEPITEQGTSYVKIDGTKVELFNALDVLALGVRLVWLAELQKDRADRLLAFQTFAVGDAALDGEQLTALAVVTAEAEATWVQRANIILNFVKERGRELAVRLSQDALGKLLKSANWELFGKRTTGHLVGGVASSALLGVTLGKFLYGTGDLYNNYSVGAQADELRRRFRAARIQLEIDASANPTSFDGTIAERYRTAYLLETFAGVQTLRSYADGVEATLGGNLRSLFNPISWFKGKEYREAILGLRQLADDSESEVERNLLDPDFIEFATGLAVERASQQLLTVDDGDAAFARIGQPSFWKTVGIGFLGQATWTYNEASRVVNRARWAAPIRTPGVFSLRACVPEVGSQIEKPATESAHYTIVHSSKTDITLSQQTSVGWVDLGMHYFEGSGQEYVELSDRTDEPTGSSVVLFDCMQWQPVANPPDLFNATPEAGSVPYAVAIAGDTAILTFTMRNTGLLPWKPGEVVILGSAGNLASAPNSIALTKAVNPGQTHTWIVRLRLTNATGVVRVTYHMAHKGAKIGSEVTGVIAVLPPELRNFEAELRRQLEAWKQQGEQKLEDLVRLMEEAIRRELEKQARSFLEQLCSGPSALVGIGLGLIVFRRQRR